MSTPQSDLDTRHNNRQDLVMPDPGLGYVEYMPEMDLGPAEGGRVAPAGQVPLAPLAVAVGQRSHDMESTLSPSSDGYMERNTRS